MTRKSAWTNREYARLVDVFGGCCAHCQSSYDLEFAHLEDTGLSGIGRGKSRRVADIRRNLRKYILLCQPCHQRFDGISYRNRYAKKIQE